jgi:glycosyltransferase involved in cell wall biosynthesis
VDIPIVMVAYHFPPSAESGAARPYRFYRHLPALGFAPHVVAAGEPGAGDGRVHFVRDAAWPPTYETVRGMVEVALRRTLFNDDGMSWTLPAAAEASRVLVREGAGVVYSTFPPINTHLVGMSLKKRHGARWIADFRDPLAGNPARRGSRGLPPWLDAAAERAIFRNADAVIANTDVVAEGWAKRYPEYRGKMRVIWNGFDPEGGIVAAPIPERPRRVLSHIGNLYGSRRPDLLLESLARLVSRGALDARTFTVQLFGPMDDDSVPASSDAVQKLTANGCLEVRNALVPRDEAARLISESDLLLLIDLLDEHAGLQVPAKLFEYVRIGRPILAFTTRHSPADRILARAAVPCSLVYLGDTEEEIDRKVRGFFELPAAPVRASEWFWREFDGSRQAAALAEIVHGVLSGDAAPAAAAYGTRNEPLRASPPQPR